jgi:AcrR family transcriptional regulator
MTSQAVLRTPRERYRDELRRTILDAAREAFNRHGYEAVSMRKLAAQVGCSHANLYLHFKDKEALFECLVEEGFEQFAEGLRKVPDSAKQADPVEFLRKAGAPTWSSASRTRASTSSCSCCAARESPRKPHFTYERMRPRSAMHRREAVSSRERRCREPGVVGSRPRHHVAPHRSPDVSLGDREQLIGQVIDAAIDALLA